MLFHGTFLLTDSIYTSFHDEEWGVPIHDDRKLFELLVFSQALAELTWPAILNKREIFRYYCPHFLCSLKTLRRRAFFGMRLMFGYLFPFGRKLLENFDPSSIAQFNEKKLLSLKVNGNLLLSEPKLRAIVENAKQTLKVIEIKLPHTF